MNNDLISPQLQLSSIELFLLFLGCLREAALILLLIFLFRFLCGMVSPLLLDHRLKLHIN